MIKRSVFFTLILLGVVEVSAQSLEGHVYNWSDLKVESQDKFDRRPILEGSTTDLEYFESHATTINPGAAPRAAGVHDDVEELIIIKEGKVRLTVKDKSKVMGPGSIAWAIPGDKIGIENAGGSQATYYVLKFRTKTPANIERARNAGGSFLVDWNDVVMKKTEKGGRREIVDRPTAMFERFEMHVSTLNKGLASHDPHTHAAEEVVLLISGDATMVIGTGLVKAAPGAVVFLASMVPHALRNNGDGACEYFAFQWQSKK